MLEGRPDVRFGEGITTQDIHDRGRLHLEYKRNRERSYLSSQTTGVVNRLRSSGGVELSGGRIGQRLRNADLSIDHKTHLLYAGAGARRIEATLSGGLTQGDSHYLTEPDASLSGTTSGRAILQDGRLRTYRLSALVQIPDLNILPRVRYTLALSGGYRHRELEGDFRTSGTLLGENLLRDHELKVGMGQTLAYLSTDSRLRLQIPLYYTQRRTTQTAGGSGVNARWTLEPRLDWTHNRGMNWGTEPLAQLGYTQPSTTSLYDSYTAQDYRTIVRGGRPLDLDRTARLSATLKYRDIFRLFASSLQLSFVDRYSSLVSSWEIGTDHNETHWLREGHHTRSWLSKMSASKGYEWMNTMLEAWLQLSRLSGYMGMGQSVEGYRRDGAEIYLSAKVHPVSRLYVDVEGRASLGRYTRASGVEQRQTTWQETLRLRYLLSQSLELEGALADYHLRRDGSSVAHLFVDASLSYRRGATLISLELQNLMGTRAFVQSSQTEYGVFVTEHWLRPRSIMIKGKFSF